MRSSSRTSAAAAITPKCFRRRASGRCATSIAATARSSTASGFKRDYQLQAGDIVRIGNSHLAFVHDLSQAFPDSHSVLRTAQAGRRGRERRSDRRAAGRRKRARNVRADDDHASPRAEPLSRAAGRGRRRCLVAEGGPGGGQLVPAGVRAGQGDGRRHAGECGARRVVRRHAGRRRRRAAASPPADRQSSRSTTWKWSPRGAIRRIAITACRNSCRRTVMRDGQAVLARNVMDDSQLGSRDSKGEILATSVICAPIRREGKVLGVIHLYSTDAGTADRSGRSGIHAGRGRHGGRGPGEPQPAAGAGRESQSDPRRERAAPRAAGRARARSSARAR